MTLFKVMWDGYNNDIKRVFEVYNIRDDKNGYPHFLLYHNKQWVYVSAKHCIPVTNHLQEVK